MPDPNFDQQQNQLEIAQKLFGNLQSVFETGQGDFKTSSMLIPIEDDELKEWDRIFNTQGIMLENLSTRSVYVPDINDYLTLLHKSGVINAGITPALGVTINSSSLFTDLKAGYVVLNSKKTIPMRLETLTSINEVKYYLSPQIGFQQGRRIRYTLSVTPIDPYGRPILYIDKDNRNTSGNFDDVYLAQQHPVKLELWAIKKAIKKTANPIQLHHDDIKKVGYRERYKSRSLGYVIDPDRMNNIKTSNLPQNRSFHFMIGQMNNLLRNINPNLLKDSNE